MLGDRKEEALMIVIERIMGECTRRQENGASKRMGNLFEGARVIHSSPTSPTMKRERLLMVVVEQMLGDYRRQGGENEQVYNLHETAKRVHDAVDELEFNQALGWPIPPIDNV